jgi:broad specificity phosphatase PhoE
MATNSIGTTVILIRHADRTSSETDQDPPLNDKGKARAQTLVHVLGTAGIKLIYHSRFRRSKETAEPLAAHLGIAKKQLDDPPEIQHDILTTHAGKAVLVIGHSNTVPALINLLSGVGLPNMDDREFDNLFIVTVLSPGQANVTHLQYGEPTP